MRLAPILLLLAACASSAGRVLVLESDGFMCGAEQGLGCGLAVEPALEEIDALPGVARSEVSWDGRVFRIELEPGADLSQVRDAASEVLRADPTCDVREVEPSEPVAREARWLDASSALELSLHEADVLARRFAEEICGEVELDEEDRRALGAALLEEIERAFRDAHAAGAGVHRLHEQFPDTRARFESRIAGFLTGEQRVAVLECLDRAVAR
jgi:hypothetical protein